MRLSLMALCLATVLLPGLSLAHEVRQDHLRIAHPFATPTPPGAPHGAAYLDISIDDDGETATLVGASTPMSQGVELHDMRLDEGTMRMRKLDEIVIEPGETVTLRPGGGPHLMLLGLTSTLSEGDTFPLMLEFAEREAVEVEVRVQEANAGIEAADDHHDH